MSWNEPRLIAERLSARLDLPLWKHDVDPGATDGILLLAEEQLADVAAALLARSVATVVTGSSATATSAGLVALRDRVSAAGAIPVVSTFATVPDADSTRTEVPLVVAARPGDALVAQLLAAGPHALTLDPTVVTNADGPPARVCIVTFEVSGLTGGGIGTASTSLAETLARTGHDVTLLFTGWQDAADEQRNERWRHHYAERGVRLAFVRAPGTSSVKSPHFPVRSAYEVYCWLQRDDPFDVVHLPENMGHGAFAQLAKRQGALFAATTFVIGTHGPTRWAAEANRVALTREEFLVNDQLERISVAHADVLLGPSRYLHDYMRERGWQLPSRVHVQPYATPSTVREGASAREAKQLPDEIVFFGRLETRKGVATLCDALDLLSADVGLPSFAVTFLGPVAHVLGESADAYIAARGRNWPWSWQIISDRDQQGAAEYLSRPGVLSVMPSLVDNAPNTVSEAIALGIPLVAGRTGGTGELVAAEQRDDHMFDSSSPGSQQPLRFCDEVPAADARTLAELLRRRLTTVVAPALPAADPAAVEAAYDHWHRGVRAARDVPTEHASLAPTLPSLSICVLFAGHEELLAAQLDALAEADAEVVVADLREQPDDSIAAADAHGVRAIWPTTAGHAGQARNAFIAATHGELIAFLPPNDVPLEPFATAMRSASAATGADVYGCVVLDARDGDGHATAATDAFVPLPGPPLAGLTHPAFTAGPYAIRRAALDRLGGFATDARGDEADHELLNRAAVAGMRLEVVPEPLAVKRLPDRFAAFRAIWPHDTIDPPYDAEQWLRVERPFADDPSVRDLVGLLRGERSDTARFQTELHRQHDVYEARFAEQRTWIENLEAEASTLRVERTALAAKLARQPSQIAVRAARRAKRLLQRNRS